MVDKYTMSEKWEYVAIRNAVGVFDSSPLYKYRIAGPDAERFLAGGNGAEATKIYDEVRKADVPKQNVLEATRGAILARQAGVADLERVAGIGTALARTLYDHLHPGA